jgi:hypothetical protein
MRLLSTGSAVGGSALAHIIGCKYQYSKEFFDFGQAWQKFFFHAELMTAHY